MAIPIKAPAFPESVADGSIATWHKKPGDAVTRDELLVDIETDKVVMEVLAEADGVLGEIHKHEGDTVLSGEVLGTLNEGASAAAAPAAKPSPAAASAAPSSHKPPAATTHTGANVPTRRTTHHKAPSIAKPDSAEAAVPIASPGKAGRSAGSKDGETMRDNIVRSD